MISLKEIQNFYPPRLQGFRSFLLREYLQYKILEIIFNSEYSNKLSFLGGTCLRIVHNNSRFSEDLDFDNFNLSESDFISISGIIEKKLTREGYTVEIKNVFRGAYHCYIRLPGSLFSEGITNHVEEKILIQLDTEPQNYKYSPQKYILNKFDIFTQINVTPVELLLSQKIYALLNRKRLKGRDFYDILFLLKFTRPDFEYLSQKVQISSERQLKERLIQVCLEINMDDMAKDVEPFLFFPDEKKSIVLFPEYIKQLF